MYSTTEEVNCICNMSKNYSEKHSLEAHGIKDWVTERNTTYFGDRFKRGYLDLNIRADGHRTRLKFRDF